MMITNFNEMSIEELGAIHDYLGIALEISDGKVVGSVHEKSTVTDGQSEQR